MGSTGLLVGVAMVAGSNEARPVPEGNRAGCANSLLVTSSFPGRACHPLNPVAPHVASGRERDVTAAASWALDVLADLRH